MAYTDLATQSAGQTASATGWANVVKANFESMGPHLVARKLSDESIPSSSALQPDNDLILPVVANGVYFVEFGPIFSGSNAGDIKIGFSFPDGGRIAVSTTGDNASAVTFWIPWHGTDGTAGNTGAWGFNCIGVDQRSFISIRGVYRNGGTAGDLAMHWAQNSPHATATVMHIDSTLWAMKLA